MRRYSGFTLIEVMIAIAIIGIIAAVAIPSYNSYTRSAYFTEIVTATSPYKTAVSACITRLSSMLNCNAGTNGIPPSITTAVGKVASLTVRAGTITVTPVAQNGILTTDTYILTPSRSETTGNVTWSRSGGGVTKGYTK